MASFFSNPTASSVGSTAMAFLHSVGRCRRRSEMFVRSKIAFLARSKSSPAMAPPAISEQLCEEPDQHPERLSGEEMAEEKSSPADSTCASSSPLEPEKPTEEPVVAAPEKPKPSDAKVIDCPLPSTPSLPSDSKTNSHRRPRIPSAPSSDDGGQKDNVFPFLNGNVIFAPSEASTPTSAFPLSPSMTSHALSFVRRLSDCHSEMKPQIQEWTFMHTIRKKEVPLNKFGLPDVPADVLVKNRPDRQIIEAMRHQWREVAEKKLLEGWDDGTGFESVIDLFAQLLDLICSFVGQKQAEKYRTALDIDVLKQMVEARVYTPNELQATLKTCVGILFEMESPYQHLVTQKWFSELKFDYASKEEYVTAICDTIMYIFKKCDLCKLEVENYYVSRISKADRQVREREAFLKIPLPLRTPWDCSSKEHFSTGLLKACSENATNLEEDAITSCLALDINALHHIQYKIQEVTLLGVMAVVLNKLLVKHCTPEIVEGFFSDVLEEYMRRRGPNLIFGLLSKLIPEESHAEGQECCSQIVKCADVNDPLYKVLRDRVLRFCKDEPDSEDILGSKPPNLCYANRNAVDLKAAFQSFVNDHWEVYGPIYTRK